MEQNCNRIKFYGFTPQAVSIITAEINGINKKRKTDVAEVLKILYDLGFSYSVNQTEDTLNVSNMTGLFEKYEAWEQELRESEATK